MLSPPTVWPSSVTIDINSNVFDFYFLIWSLSRLLRCVGSGSNVTAALDSAVTATGYVFSTFVITRVWIVLVFVFHSYLSPFKLYSQLCSTSRGVYHLSPRRNLTKINILYKPAHCNSHFHSNANRPSFIVLLTSHIFSQT